MKNVFKSLMIVLMATVCLATSVYAQEKSDVITMRNGEKKTGKVKAVKDQSIVFVYNGETLEYEFKKSDIEKIDFASGRTEQFNASSGTDKGTKLPGKTASTTPEQRKNIIAVMPFEIQTNDAGLATESMSKQVQQACISALRDQSPFQSIQDPMITNNILAKNQFAADNISQHTPQEWAEILGVQYVIIGSYKIDNKGSSTYGSGVSSFNSKNTDNKSKGSVVSSGNSYTTTNYNTRIFLNVYTDNGDQVFTDSRSTAFGGLDSYKSALKTLVKRTPFGKK